jgi:hypothetical protein
MTEKDVWSRDDSMTVAVAAALIGLLYLARLSSYLLFHTLAELVFVIVCFTVLIMALALRRFLDDDFAAFLGVAMSAAALLHIVHLVDYPGLGMISASPDPPTQLWLAARLLLAVSFAVAPFVLARRLNLGLVATIYAGYDAIVLATIYWWHVFPATLLVGTGLTPFKKIAEYVICLIFAAAIVLFWRRRAKLPYQSWRLLRAALVASIVAELWFTLYHTVATWPNLIGHLFLVVSALLLFRAVVDDGLARPHALAVSHLREAEGMHRRLERGLMPSLPFEREGVTVLSHYRPGEHQLDLSGDFIDVLDRGDAGVAVICGDVSGHGPDAAALGAMLRASWQALSVSGADPATIVESLRAVLERERKDNATYATVCLAWIDPVRDEVRLVNIGHPVPLLLAHDVTPLPVAPIPPLGTIDRPVDEPQRIALPGDWRLFFYTDGLIEGRSAAGSAERYGEERLIEALRPLRAARLASGCLERLLSEVQAAGGGEPFIDDVAVILIAKAAATRDATSATSAPASQAADSAGRTMLVSAGNAR